MSLVTTNVHNVARVETSQRIYGEGDPTALKFASRSFVLLTASGGKVDVSAFAANVDLLRTPEEITMAETIRALRDELSEQRTRAEAAEAELRDLRHGGAK